MNGYIVKGIGGFYYVKTPDGIVEGKPLVALRLLLLFPALFPLPLLSDISESGAMWYCHSLAL